MGGEQGKLCTQASSHSALASEDSALLRWEYAETRDRITHLQETLYVQMCQNEAKAGRKKPKRGRTLEAPPLLDSAKLALPRLQEELERLEALYQELRYREEQQVAEALTRSTLRPSTLEAKNLKSVAIAAQGISLMMAGTTDSRDSEASLRDHTLLFGLEDDYGLTWDRTWVDMAAGPKNDQQRQRTRQGTKDKVVSQLGLSHFGEAASMATSYPPQSSQTVLFADQRHAQEEGAAAGGSFLLGRYDTVFVKVCADFDREWRFIKGPRQDFWVAHAAALNVGESTKATDFPDFCRLANSGEASGSLDEERYYEAMGQILTNVVTACETLRAEHLIFFPFGMGAFLRHLGQLDGNFADDEQLQRLRRRLAHRFIEVLSRSNKRLQIHLCLGFSAEEPQRNADAFLRACYAAGVGLSSRLTVWPEGDSLQLAHELAERSPHVVLVNGANRQLLGNHWFAGRAKLAIDENLHRRSWRLAATSYLLNGFDGQEPSGRLPDDLQRSVLSLGGRVERLAK